MAVRQAEALGWASSDPYTETARPDRVVRGVRLPGGGRRTDVFDLLGRLVRRIEPDGTWLRCRYGASGALERIDHSSGEWAEYRFDPSELTWTAQTDGTRTVLRVGADGLPVELEQTVDGLGWTVGYRWSEPGRPAAVLYPGGEVPVELVPDGAGGGSLRAGEREYCNLSDSGRVRFANGTESWERTQPGRPPVLAEAGMSGSDGRCERAAYVRDAEGRIVRAADRSFEYDGRGRLTAARGARVLRMFTYDERGRRSVDVVEVDGGAAGAGAGRRHRDDALGRRVATEGREGTTRYAYDMLGRLFRVETPDGRSIAYRYDGMGRLVAREADGEVTYVVCGFDGHRLAEAGPDGAIVRSYLWLGPQCVGLVDGPAGGPLARSFHRLPGIGVTAVGNADGILDVTDSADPFGSDHPVRPGIPGYSGLLGDSDTGLWLAGSRWLDPATGRFLTPDEWSFEEPTFAAQGPVRRLFRAAPDGPERHAVDADGAYDWCGHDPVNRVDPSGHNWLGLIFSTISALLWSMQETSVALEFYVLDILLDVIQLVIGREFWDTDGYWRDSVFNLVLPTASYRLMVPLAINLNGLTRGGAGAVWTLGNVIWGTGDEFRKDAKNATRDLILCSNAGDYLAAANEQVADVFRVRNDATRTQGTCNAAGTRLTSTTLPGGAAGASTVFSFNDWILVKLTAGGQPDEAVVVTAVSGNDVSVSPAVPAAFRSQPVEWTRLDVAAIRMERDGKRVSRPVTMVRGKAIHYVRRVDDDAIAEDGLQVSEFLPAVARKAQAGVGFSSEQSLLRVKSDADRNGYAVADFVRIQNATTYLARVVKELRAARDLVVDPPLPAGTPTTDLGLARLPRASDAPATPVAARAGTPGSNDRVEAGRITTLRALDGLEISTGGATPTIERRIVTGLLLDCAVAALPAALQSAAVKVDGLAPDQSNKASGTMSGADGTKVAFGQGQTGRFSGGQPVRVSAGGTDAYGVADSDSTDQELHLTEALPQPAFGDGVAVQVVLMARTGTFDADDTSAAGDHVVCKVDRGDAIAAGQQLRIRPAASDDGGAVRTVNGDPVLVAALDSALPAAFTTGLSVQRFAPDSSSTRGGVKAPAVRHHLVMPGPGHGLAVNDVVVVQGFNASPPFEEWVVTEVTAVNAADVTIADYVETNIGPVRTQVVAATGKSTPDAKLGDALVLIPSDPDRDPLGRREAVQNHEMRHVWQYAVWGPFFFSLPLPWLFHLGFSFGDRSQDASQLIRHISLGGLDSLVALAFWGLGGADPATTLTGQVGDTNRKQVTFGGSPDPAKVAKFTPGSYVEVTEAGVHTFNVIDALDAGQDRITLRFGLEHAAQGDAVTVSVSPFEQIRKTINTMFNFEQLWSSHIPQAWGRALSNLLNRDSWFPGIGWYPLAAYAVGFDQNRISFEQDASYQSGDTYTNIVVARPGEVFVGQLAKLYVFVNNRFNTISELLSTGGQPLRLLTVELPPDPSGAAAVAAKVPGSILLTGSNEVTFREHRFIRMGEQVENAVGVYFAAGVAGDYRLHNAGALPADKVVFQGFAATSFVDLATLKVKPLGLSPDPTADLFETEEVTFRATGDPAATYAMRFPTGTAGKGRVSGLRYSAPLVAAGAGSVQDTVQVTATYPPDLPFLRTGGELPHALTADDLTNLCEEHTLTVRELAAPPIGPVQAGSTTDFQMGIAPVSVTVTSPVPAGATRNASVQNLGGKPAKLKFVAPDKVTAATNVTFEMVFGTDPAVRKTVPVTMQVTPTP